jgi:amino acid adenylation domain-containing protein
MLKAYLLELSEHESKLVISMHHLVSDGWSLSIFIQELAEFYKSHVEHRTAELQPLKLQYGDYAYWQRQYLKGEILDKKVSYWKDKLVGVEPLQLPTDYPRPAVQRTNGDIVKFSISKELASQLQELSQAQGTTLFMTLQAAFKVLLHRYSNQEDICIGSAIADRQQQEIEGLIGFFVNTLALRNQVSDDMPFIDLLQQVRTTTLEAYEHQEVPFEKIVEVVMKERDMSRNPLFQVMLVWQNTAPVSELDLGEVQLIQEEIGLRRTKFDITFIVTETAFGLEGVVEYSTSLYKASTIHRMTGHLAELLSSIVKTPAQSIGTLSLLTVDERQRLTEFNSGASFSSGNKTFLQLFDEQVSKLPNNTALAFGQQQLSYKDLNERSNELASFLISKGLREEMLVPVCMNRSVDLVISLLAIMKAGGAYVPIDPDYPEERIAYMLQDTGAALVITNNIHHAKLHTASSRVIVNLDTEWPEIRQYHQVPSVLISPFQLAYVIYTSGSTGKPKGVLIEQQGLVNLIDWHIREYAVTDKSRATAMAGVGFDAFGWELWPYLSTGATVHIVSDELRLESRKLVEFFSATEITHSFVSTALLPDFISVSADHKTSLRYLLTGGDKLGAIDTSVLSYKVVNNYGPTEYTVVTTNYSLSEKDRGRTPPIGRPIGNTTVLIVDRQKQPVPIGVVGELCVGGKGLARGYLNQPELTKEKFSMYSFSNEQIFREPGIMRMYSTGDLARWLEDGNIEYMGRKDDQVKIRGYRIELGEIESVLLQSGYITQALVIVKEDQSGDKQLAAYVVPNGNFNREDLLSYLRGRLPDYMVPQWWVPIQNFPLTANGKIDRKALPAIDFTLESGNEYTPPETEMEKSLVEIWKELLHLDRVSISDNFFRIGGHSLLARRMASHIERNLSVTVPIQMLFQFNTIRELGKYLELQINKQPREKGSKGFKLLNI